MKASLIITTYNWPEALRVVLRSVLDQSVSEIEVVVADDGSDSPTAQSVRQVLGPSPLPWCHVRHADRGIRQARIKNLGVRYSHAPYLIFVDHDLVLHPRFVEDHLAASERGVFLQGKRTFLPPGLTRRVLEHGKAPLPSFLFPGLRNRKNAFRAPRLGRLLMRPRRFQTSLRGCNLSMYREDFLAVDGYDETFDGLWGREDSDICYRLFHHRIRCRNLWFCALQYHLDHPVTKNRSKDRLDHELRVICREKRTKALRGYSQLGQEGEVVAASVGYPSQEGEEGSRG